MAEDGWRSKRMIAVIAATFVSLACGTNYAYSAWGPQFADRMHLTATQQNLIGASGNMGMYASGIPFGYMIDNRGPKPGVALGGILIGTGYFFIKQAFDEGPGSYSIVPLCLFGFLTGCGSCSAFQGAIKTAALNWPHHRGTATAFPLSAFGLSAVIFVAISGLLFPDSTSSMLLLLAIGTTILVLGSLAWITVPLSEQYQAVSSVENNDDARRRDSSPMQRTKVMPRVHEGFASSDATGLPSSADGHAEESHSLLSSEDGDITEQKRAEHHSRPRADVTGLKLLRIPEFYLLFTMMGALTGIGLMTINNIGNDAKALWMHYDPSTPKSFILRRQLFHVSVISLCSFCGRLLSGMGSDLLVKRLKASRYWCLVVSSLIFGLAQIAAFSITTPQFLFLVSALTGLAYGTLFGVSPAIVADGFGVKGMAMNWGIFTLSPVIFGNIFNLVYGHILDSNSHFVDGERKCNDGLECYKGAYYFTFVTSVGALLVGLYSVVHDRKARLKREAEDEIDEHLS